MKRKNYFFILITMTLVFLVSTACKKNDMCVAGTGGPVSVAVFPKRAGNEIFSTQDYLDTAYVKFNSQTFPGAMAESYDLVIAGNVGEDHIHIPNLKCGDYFIYVTGFDSTINKRVSGGVPYIITQTYGGELDTEVPVYE